jgi:hypothetical protein
MENVDGHLHFTAFITHSSLNKITQNNEAIKQLQSTKYY